MAIKARRADRLTGGEQVVERDGALLDVVAVEVTLKSANLTLRSMVGDIRLSLPRSARVNTFVADEA